MKLTGAALVMILGVMGCVDGKPPDRYMGPTESLPRVVERINQNNQRIHTLYATLDFEAHINDPNTKESHFVNGSGVLQVRKPMELRLIAEKDIAGPIF